MLKRITGIAILAALMFAAGMIMVHAADAQGEISGDGPNHPWYTPEELETLHGQGNTRTVLVTVEEHDGDIFTYMQKPDSSSWYKALD